MVASSSVVNLESLLMRTRDAIASGDQIRAVVAIATIADYRDRLSPTQLTDILERTCAYGSRNLVEWTFTALESFPYRGWALALALRCAREDVSRYLLGRGVDLLEDVRREDKYRPISAHERGLSRHDLTRSSSGLLIDPFGRSVASEVFSPFSGNEQLLGGAFSTTTDIAATCDLVGRLACEAAFDSVVFDDLLRAVIAHASDVMDAPRNYAPYAMDACLGLAARMIRLWHEDGQGGKGVDLVLGGFLQPCVHRRIISFICATAPEVFVSRISSLTWLRNDPQLIRVMTHYLAPLDADAARPLLQLLARNGYMTELEIVSEWPGILTSENIDEAMAEASGAGRAEAAAWLLARGQELVGDHDVDGNGVPDDIDDLLL